MAINNNLLKKKILIFGAGVIGSVYGGLLAKSGHQVSILARGHRLSELKSKGLLLYNSALRKPEGISIEVVDSTQVGSKYDFVFVALRYDQVDSALKTLSKIDTSCFVFMVNNPKGYEQWTNELGYHRVIPAFPGAGGKIENGIVYYQIVSSLVQPTTLGELNGKQTQRLKDLKTILRRAGFNIAISKKMEAWQISHIALIAPLAAVIYYDGGDNYSVSKNKKAISQMNLALKENLNFLIQSGIGVEPYKLRIIRFIPMIILTKIMRLVFATKWAETVICNHALNAKGEMELINHHFIQMAKGKGFYLKEFEKISANQNVSF